VRSEQEVRAVRLVLIGFLYSHRDGSTALHQWLEDFREIGLGPCLETELTLCDEAENFARLVEVSSADGEFEQFSVAMFGGQAGASDHLNLITLHSAKGLEFDIVVMMGMDQGLIPSWSADS